MFRQKINERTKALIYSAFVTSLVMGSLFWIANYNMVDANEIGDTRAQAPNPAGTISGKALGGAPLCVFNNGGLNPLATAENGTAAPAGKFWSEVQHNAGNLTEANSTIGAALQSGLFRLADNFTVPAGGCQLNTVTFFAYQTNSPATPSPFSASTLRIWNGRPGDVGATIIFGDTTTNRLASSVNSDMFRISNTVVPAPIATGTTRVIWRNTLNVGASLAPGTYWLDWDLTATNAAAMFAPGKTIQGSRGAVGDNARQQTVAGGAWADVIDLGTPATAPDVPQDFPFFLNTLVASDAPVDFNNDGRTDYAVVRNVGGGANGQVNWFYNLNNSANPTVAFAWGLASDTFITEDFDNDNRDDIAVWRAGAPTVAAFYIFNSATNTVRVERFGQTGDDPTVVGDYNGDGSSDIAVYRSGASAGLPSTWYYRTVANGPVTFVQWGQNGDFPAPGDYDGNGSEDFGVQRAGTGGQGNFWIRLSTGATSVTAFGTPNDTIVPGDYDGDGKTDIATVRGVSGSLQWAWLASSNGSIQYRSFGASASDFPAHGDYDGDGKTDVAVWRSSATAGLSAFYSLNSSNAATRVFPFGANGDYPVANFNTH